MATAVTDEVIIEFESNLSNFDSGIKKMIDNFKKLRSSTDEVNVGMKVFSDNVGKSANAMNDSDKASEKQNKSLGKSAIKWGTIGVTLTKAYTQMSKWTKSSIEAESVQERFNSIFGKTKDLSTRVNETLTNLQTTLYADERQIQKTMTAFGSLTRSMGVTEEASNTISSNLTQMAYDLAAVENVSIDTTTNAITAALSGQQKAMSKWIGTLNQATLQETLYNAGINRKVSSLNAAQKAELYYYEIMRRTAQYQGYAANAMMQPAQAASIAKSQFAILGRAIGNLFLPMVMKAIPYAIALAQVLTELAQKLATLFNLNIDFSNSVNKLDFSGISAGIDDIGESADGTAKKIKNLTRDFDELHIVNFDDALGGGSGISAGAGGLGLDLDSVGYDYSKFTNQFSDQVEKIKEKLKVILPYIEAIGIGLAAWKLFDFITSLSVGGNLLLKILENANKLSFVLGAMGLFLTFSGISTQLKEGMNAENIIQTLIGGGLLGGAVGLKLFKSGKGLGLSLEMGLTIFIGVVAFELGMSIGEWLKEKLNLPERFDYYIKEFNLDIDNDSLWEQIKKITKIVWNSLNDGLTEEFGITMKQVTTMIAIGLGTAIIAGSLLAATGIPRNNCSSWWFVIRSICIMAW